MQEAREEHGMTQEQLALDFNLSKQMVSHIECDRRKMPKDVMPKAVETLDCGFLSMETAAEVTGGAWVGKLNGDNVDLHRSSVKAKAMEELKEAMFALENTCLVNHPSSIDHTHREDLKRMLFECIDVIVCLSHLVAVVCKEYGISWFKIWKDHKLKLVAKKYLKFIK